MENLIYIDKFNDSNDSLNSSDIDNNKISCTFCDKQAVHETVTNNNYLCDDNDCKLQYVEEIIKPLK